MPPNFFEETRSNHRRSIFLMVTTFLILYAFINLIAVVVGGYSRRVNCDQYDTCITEWYWNPVTLGVTAAIVALYLWIAYLSSAKAALALTKSVPATGPEYAQLRNLVEGVSIAAGVPMPAVYVINDPAPNAFATGLKPSKASVTVTTGLLAKMSRGELEGVLAHEVAHISNGDMVTMTLLQGVLNTFVVFFSRVIGLLVDSFLQGNRRDDEGRSSGTGIGFFIGSLVAQIFLGLLASMVVMAYSRRREFAADAMAARIEGKDAMIGALQRLKVIHEGGGVLDDRSASLAAFKISHNYGNWFASHPPLDHRIQALQNAH